MRAAVYCYRHRKLNAVVYLISKYPSDNEIKINIVAISFNVKSFQQHFDDGKHSDEPNLAIKFSIRLNPRQQSSIRNFNEVFRL